MMKASNNVTEGGPRMSRSIGNPRIHYQASVKLPDRSFSGSVCRPNQAGAKRGHSPSMRSRSQSPSNENAIARSKAEQAQFDVLAESGISKSGGGKFRQLPCRTFIATGHCPYKDRCVYLHCPSIRSPFECKFKNKRKNKEDIVADSLFWPIMPHSSDSVDNEYIVPKPEADMYERHDLCLISLWRHYVQVCKRVQTESSLPSLTGFAHAKAKRELVEFTPTSDDQVNLVTKRPRLELLRTLSKGEAAVNTNEIISAPGTPLAVVPIPVIDARITISRPPSPALSASSTPFTPAAAPALKVGTPPQPQVKGFGISSPVSVTNAWDCLSPQISHDVDMTSPVKYNGDIKINEDFVSLMHEMPRVQSIATKTSNRLKALVGASTSLTPACDAENFPTHVSRAGQCASRGTNVHNGCLSFAPSFLDRGDAGDTVETVLTGISNLSMNQQSKPLSCHLSADSPVDLSFIGIDDEEKIKIMGICEATAGLMSSPASAAPCLSPYPASTTSLCSSKSAPAFVESHPIVDEWADSDGEGGFVDERQALAADGDSLGSETIFGSFPLLGQRTKLSHSPSFNSDLNRLSELSSLHGVAFAPSVASATDTPALFTPFSTLNPQPKSRSVYGVSDYLPRPPAPRDVFGGVSPMIDVEDDNLTDWNIVRDSPCPNMFCPVAKQALKPASSQYAFPSF